MLSKALVIGAYQRKCELIAALPGIHLTVLVPRSWRTSDHIDQLVRAHTVGYDLREVPLRFNGNFHLHYYPTLQAELRLSRPDILHIDEEPYNLATFLALRTAHVISARALFFSWQNLNRRYPPPFRWMERYVLQHSDGAIGGNADAVRVLISKGYKRRAAVIPQFGVDMDIFSPQSKAVDSGRFMVGYVGRLVREKGVDVLIQAISSLPAAICATITGAGDMLADLQALVQQCNLSERVTFAPQVSSVQMPDVYRNLDALVLPSRTQSNWKEQFGRVLIEAMACGVPVIGSTCGEIPNVISDAGLMFPENSVSALAEAIRSLYMQVDLRKDLASRGRSRVNATYTMQHIAERTVDMYHAILQSA